MTRRRVRSASGVNSAPGAGVRAALAPGEAPEERAAARSSEPMIGNRSARKYRTARREDASRASRHNAADGPPRRARTPLRPRVLPRRPGGDRARRARGPGPARGDADRVGQVDRLPASGAPSAGHDPGRFAAHRADEGPGRRARPQGHPGRRRSTRSRRPPNGARAEAAMREGRLRLLYVAPERFASEAFRRLLRGFAAGPLRRRRGPLRLGVGPRLPAGLPDARRRRAKLPPRRRR